MTDLHSMLLALSVDAGGPMLALDTSAASAAVCTVGWRPGEVEELDLPAASMPSESLAAAIARSRDATRLDVARLRAIAVGLGPGSFTGLRVGLATAKGLAFGAGVPLYGVSSLAVLAASCGEGWVAPILDARVGEVFGALYEVTSEGVRTVIEDAAYLPERLGAAIASAAVGQEVRLVGSGAAACAEAGFVGTVVEVELRAGWGLALAAERIRRGEAEDLATLAPLYLRLSEAERQQARR